MIELLFQDVSIGEFLFVCQVKRDHRMLSVDFLHSAMTWDRNLHSCQSIDYPSHHLGDMSFEMSRDSEKIQPK